MLFFYPKDDTPGCTVENKDFSALSGEFAKAGAALLGVSKDPPKKHQKFIDKYALTAPLASDAEAGWAVGRAGRLGGKEHVWPHLHGNGADHFAGRRQMAGSPKSGAR